MNHTLTKGAGVKGLILSAAAALSTTAWAQDASIEERLAALEGTAGGYVDNSFLFLLSGMVVMFMAAGFCMLEAGLVRSKNAAMQTVKNISLFSISGIMFYFIGYMILYPGTWIVEGVLGMPAIWSAGDLAADSGAGYSPASDWFFQMVFVATAASIVSGTVAERIKLLPFLIFVAVLTGIIYPIQCSWQWGGGWLSEMGFSDFAGSTLVHSVGGWAALTGAIILGPRIGKYADGKVNPMPGSNIPLAALGTFILWLGWFGFNGGSQLAAEGFENINSVAMIFANTNMAAAGGVVVAMLVAGLRYGKVDATFAFNGAIGGLVAITAEPLTPVMWQAVLIGGVGGLLVVITVPLLDALKIDDVVGAIPAHLVAGIFGTLVVPATNSGTSFVTQLIGVVAIGAFVIVTSAIMWFLLKLTVGLRMTEEEELEGLDKAECGLEAYPEFVK